MSTDRTIAINVGGRVQASSIYAGTTPFYAIDNNTGTEWIVNGGLPGTPAWFYYDFGILSSLDTSPPSITDTTSGKTITADSNAGGGFEETKAIDDNTGTLWSSSNSVYPHWIKVDYGIGNTKTIKSYTITARSFQLNDAPGSWKLQGSNDNSSWTDLDSEINITWAASEKKIFLNFTNKENIGAYRYYRLYVTKKADGGTSGYCQIAELELSEDDLNSQGQYQSESYTIRTRISPYNNQGPGTFKYQGSNDNSSWTDLDSQTGITWTSLEQKTFTIINNNSYRFYRVYITATQQGTYAAINELEIFSTDIQSSIIDDFLSLSDSFTLQTNPDNQSVNDSLFLSDSWNLQVNPDEQELNELLSLSENWDIHISNEELGIDEILDLSDNWSVLINPESQIISETLNISDNWIVNAFGTYYAKLRTDFRWLQTVVASISTSFSWLKAKFLNTDFRWLGNVNKSISTDFRWITQPYTALTPIGYTDIQIFINEIDVFLGNDVNLQSGNIIHTVGNTSTASFVLARRHDDLDRTHLGVASQITNQNPVQIYIKGHLEFDGYISGISVDSESETVSISAKMDEPEDNRHSIELPLPSVNEKLHLYHCLVNNVQIDNPKEDTRSVIVGSNGRYWSGSTWVFYIEDALTFATDTLAEAYITNLLTSEESITNEFDRIFTKKSPSVTSRERNPQYYKGIKASLGTKITQQIDKYRLLEYIINGKGQYAQQIEDGTFNTKPNYTYFWAVLAKNALTGIYNGDYRYIGTSLASTTTDLWVLNGVVPMYQRIKDNLEEDLGYYYVGSAPFKEISSKNGWLIPQQKWEDRNDGLYNVLEAAYDYRAYVQRVADLEYEKLKNVHGDILPVTSANLEVTFDGYYFYNIKLLTRINVTNTTVANTYKNLNGFPVSVKTININFANMKITLGCDNRLSQKELDEIDAQMPDEDSSSYLSQESAVRVYRKFDLKTWKFVS